MSLSQLIPYALEASLFGLILSIGLESRWSDIAYALSNPRVLFRAIIAVNLVVPLSAVILCTLLPIAPWTRAGLIMMAVAPLAPFAPLKMLKSGAQRSFVLGTYVALMIASVLIIPATAAILGFVAPRQVVVPPLVIAAYVIDTVITPLVIGIFVHSTWERQSERLAPIVRKLSLGLLIPLALLILWRFIGDFADLVGDGSLAVIAAMVAIGLASGYALAGRDPSERKALAEAAATRHPGLAATIAQLHSNDTRIIAAILLYLFASILFSLLFGLVLSRWRAKSPLAARAANP